MKLESGKYIGQDVEEVPTEYLEWAMGHLAMSDEMNRAVMAEYSRRANQERVDAESPAQRVLEKVSQAATKFAANHGL